MLTEILRFCAKCTHELEQISNPLNLFEHDDRRDDKLQAILEMGFILGSPQVKFQRQAVSLFLLAIRRKIRARGKLTNIQDI